MCDTALSFARDHLVPLARDHLLPLFKEAADMILCVPKEIAELKDELESIEDFISKADRMADVEEEEKGSHIIKSMIKKLIEASFHIEDVIDDYIFREEQQSPDIRCAAGVDLVKTKFLRLQIAYKIHNIKSLISEINDTSTKKDHGSFQIESSWDKASSSSANASLLQNHRDAPFHMDEAGFVGFEEPRDKLIDLLVEGRAECTVVSLFGMGGQGKTTLAKKVFDNQKVVKHFDCHVWITVSRPYDIERLLQKMLQEFYKQKGDNPRQMDRKSLVDEVRNYLQEKRYVVVFDDVWDSHFWYDIEFAMIDNKKGSRILFTTRNMSVAHACENSSFVKVLQLKPLTKEKSLELFNKKAFYNLDGRCPEKLIYISSKIVEKCNGLPLAIVVIGGLLSRRDRNTIEWYKFWENINLELNGDYTITRILGLSYHDLPYNLKSCFLYFGLFPEDCAVPSKILTRLWVAEGFVKEDRRGTLEEVAEGYLKELISRSLVQVVSISIDGRVKSCRVHDLVHAMIVKKCEDLGFCKNIIEGKQLSLIGMIRRLSIATSSDNLMEGIENSHVRSLLACTPKPSLTESFVTRIPIKYRQLKVLVLERIGSHEVPKNLGSLSQLKYFMFSGSFEAIPKSIGMLQNLETLDLSYNIIKAMPKEICNLKNLRHFIGYSLCLIELKDGIGGMTSLQTLRRVDIGDGEGVMKLIQELGKLKQLRELFLINVMGKYMSVLSSSVNEMQQLEKLHIDNRRIYDRDNFVMHLNSPPPMLRSLSLTGPFDKLPEWISKLQNLVKLKFQLNCSKKMGDVMKLLKSMPTLLSLHISKCGGVEEEEVEGLHFQDGWFKNLKELYLSHFSNLSYIIIDKGALHSLKKLKVFSIPQLKTLPTSIRHLHKLEDLRITSMSEEFMQSISPVEGEEHEIFKQVPYVRIYASLNDELGIIVDLGIIVQTMRERGLIYRLPKYM